MDKKDVISDVLGVLDEAAAKMAECSLTKIRIKCESFELELEKKPPEIAGLPHIHPEVTLPVSDGGLPEVRGNLVKAPIVGVFYTSPEPGKPPFVSEGKKVNKGDVLFIIESMKLMNEVKSDFSGVVDKIFMKNGESIEYGQPVMTII